MAHLELKQSAKSNKDGSENTLLMQQKLKEANAEIEELKLKILWLERSYE